MRHLAITGIVTADLISLMSRGSLMRATPPNLRISEGTRSSAITATAPASSAMRAWSAVTTSMITPPESIRARPTFVAQVLVSLVVIARSRSLGSISGTHRWRRRAPPGVPAIVLALRRPPNSTSGPLPRFASDVWECLHRVQSDAQIRPYPLWEREPVLGYDPRE